MVEQHGFRLAARKLFITYPQCGGSKEELLAFISRLYPVTKYCISRESHIDGGLHLHAAFEFASKLDIRNSNTLDWTTGGLCHHPNIQSVKNWKATVTYIKKDGDFIEGGEELTFWRSLDTCVDVNDFLHRVKEEDPKTYWLNFKKLEEAAEAHFKRVTPLYEPVYTNFTLPMELTDWANGNLVQPQPFRPKSLVLLGTTRLGKTMWARSLGRHSYFGYDWCLDSYEPLSTYSVWDDVPWEKFSYNWKAWLGCQRDFVVTDKYRGKRRIPGGRPTIYLTNDDFRPLLKSRDLTWLNENTIFIEIKTPLFN